MLSWLASLSRRRFCDAEAVGAVVRCGRRFGRIRDDRSGGSPADGLDSGIHRHLGRPREGVITAGSDGAIWFTNEEGHSIGRITPQGVITNYTDPKIAAPDRAHVEPRRQLVVRERRRFFSGRITVKGVVTTFTDPGIGSPVEITADADGAIWFTTGGKAIGESRRTARSRRLPTWRGCAERTASRPAPDGAIWFTNYLGSSIGRLAPDGTVTTFTAPSIRYPTGITTGPDGALWFTDDSRSIGRITVAGAVTSYGTSTTVGHPDAITTGPDGALWATDRGGSIVRITIGGQITRYTAT